MPVFARACDFVLGHEGGLSLDPRDPGNWTGARVGHGQLRGTRFGISAGAYPQCDIAALTLDEARAIYRRDYWDKVRGDDLPLPLALLVFDAAVNCGVSRSTRWLQQAVGTRQDGSIGPLTLAAVERKALGQGGGAWLCAELVAVRLMFMTGLPTWPTFGAGWSRRLCALLIQAPMMERD